MRYFYIRKQNTQPSKAKFIKTYKCNHPLYNKCTLYSDGNVGLAVIQQRFDENTKKSWWDNIDKDLEEELCKAEDFPIFFDKFAGKAEFGLFPTVTVRQLMWALRLKPLPKQRWETVFDHKPL